MSFQNPIRAAGGTRLVEKRFSEPFVVTWAKIPPECPIAIPQSRGTDLSQSELSLSSPAIVSRVSEVLASGHFYEARLIEAVVAPMSKFPDTVHFTALNRPVRLE